MDPIVEKPKKSKKKLFIGIGAILALLLIGGGGYGYWWWMKGEPERKFYEALANMMSIDYLERKYATVSDQSQLGEKITVTSQTDFSQSNGPLSRINYSLIEMDVDKEDAKAASINGELFNINKSTVSARLTERQNIPGSVSINAWTTIPVNDEKLMSTYDPLGLQSSINSVFLFIPMGHFSPSQKDSIIEYAKTQKIYTIRNSEYSIVDGHDTIVYTLGVSESGMTSLSGMTRKIVGASTATSPKDFAPTGTLRIWVDERARIVRCMVPLEANNINGLTLQIDYSYPGNVSINKS